MNETFNEGDLIEATKGENIVRGRLTEDTCAGDLYVHGWCIKPLLRDGYKVTVIEKAAPALPTESGFYLHRNGFDVLYLGLDGSWTSDTDFGADPAQIARDSAPLIRLEPVADTAKKVLDDVAAWWEFGTPANVAIALTSAAKNFGVVYE